MTNSDDKGQANGADEKQAKSDSKHIVAGIKARQAIVVALISAVGGAATAYIAATAGPANQVTTGQKPLKEEKFGNYVILNSSDEKECKDADGLPKIEFTKIPAKEVELRRFSDYNLIGESFRKDGERLREDKVISGYITESSIVLASRSIDIPGGGFNTYFLTIQGKKNVYLGQMTGKFCVPIDPCNPEGESLEQYLRCNAVMVPGHLDTKEHRAAANDYSQYLNQQCIPVNETGNASDKYCE